MTRQHTDCLYTNGTKFIKSCFTYSCDKHTNTSHTGSHQHYEPVNIMPKIGWASSTLPAKMGGANSRSMGTPNCGWLPTRTDNNSLPGPCAPSNKVFTREQGPDNHRGSRTTGQRGNLGDTTYTTELCVSNFPGGKKGWGSETCDKAKGSQSICEDRALQDGSLHLLPDLLQPQDWMVKMDLKDAYLQIPIHPDHQHLLTFQWEEKTYMFQGLPFGLSAAPRVFTKLLKPVVGFLRQNGCRLIIYLDDMLMLHQDRDQLQQVTQLTCQLLESLGLMVNLKKSILTPTQELEFLGFHLCSVTMRLLIPSEKLRKIQQDARHLQDRESVSVREIARFVGKATATMIANPLTPLHYRALQLLMNSVLPLNYTQEEISTKYETVVTLTPASKKDLERWIDLKKAPLEAPVYHPDPTITIHSDASNKGWGAVLNGQLQTGGLWPPEEATHYKLSRVVSSLSSNKSIREGMAECHHSAANGQCYGCKLHQSERRDSLTATVPVSHDNLDLVCREEYNPPSRASARPPEPTGRQGTQDSEGSLRLDAEPIDIPVHKLSDGSAGDGACLHHA